MSGDRPRAIIVGAGPAGLHAALRLAEAGAAVTVCDRMASPARKFLLAGRGGLNLTHSEPRAAFMERYGAAASWLSPSLDRFPPAALRAFAAGLGEETFVGSSGRVFPRAFKASPLLRAWLARLAGLGVVFRFRHRFTGLSADGALAFETPEGAVTLRADAVLLALGGASWPRMGSDGAWVDILRQVGIAVDPLMPANMGVDVAWSGDFAGRFAGSPLKTIAARCGKDHARGEAVITAGGLEGGVVYALSAALRDQIAATGSAMLAIDLKPDLTLAAVATRLAAARPGDSLSTALKKKLGLPPQAIALLREGAAVLPRDPAVLAARIKATVLPVHGARPLDRAISSAGGIRRDQVDTDLELKALRSVFVAGEMLDWEAPTGGYLLQATFATAETAARGMAARLGLALRPIDAGEW
jgi:uncharacterized flavoprotein (TIGR03862 family)